MSDIPNMIKVTNITTYILSTDNENGAYEIIIFMSYILPGITNEKWYILTAYAG